MSVFSSTVCWFGLGIYCGTSCWVFGYGGSYFLGQRTQVPLGWKSLWIFRMCKWIGKENSGWLTQLFRGYDLSACPLYFCCWGCLLGGWHPPGVCRVEGGLEEEACNVCLQSTELLERPWDLLGSEAEGKIKHDEAFPCALILSSPS